MTQLVKHYLVASTEQLCLVSSGLVLLSVGWQAVNYKKLSYCWETVRLESMPRSDCWNGRGNDNLGWNDLQMYFKVIKSGINRKLVYDFLLVVYSDFCRITHRFWEIWCETAQWPWNMPKVIDSHMTWKLSCGHVCKMFGRQWPNEPKIAIFYDPTLIWRSLSSEPPQISA